VRRAAAAIAGARAFASFEDLGVQMNRHSTLVSWLHRVLIVVTGSLGKPGTHFFPTTLVDIADGEAKRTSPVVGARLVGGLVPCNAIADEILTEHPRRYRAMLVEAANPAHSLADSPRMRAALAALDTLVVIDTAMSETARLAHYVLPAASQFEKAEATFFNFEFPDNVFHLRHRLLPPRPGTLPEAEIHARLCEALGAVTEADLAPLRAAAAVGRDAYLQALLARVLPDPRLSGVAPVLLYRTLPLADDVREGAVRARPGAQGRDGPRPGAGARRLRRAADGRGQRAVRRDRRGAVGRGVRRRRVGRRARADRHARSQAAPGDARDAGGAGRADRRRRGQRSRVPAGAVGRRAPRRSPPTRSSATRRGARRTPAARCGSTPTTPGAGRSMAGARG
jgi:hypothetical protein